MTPGPQTIQAVGVRARPNYPAQFAYWVEPDDVTAGASVALKIQFDLDAGWHIYSTTMPQEDAGPRATVITLTETAGLEPAGVFRPDSEPIRKFDAAVGMQTEYHEGRVVWTQALRVPAELAPGEYQIRGSIYHQLCDPSVCLPPQRVHFEAQLKVGPGGSAGSNSSEGSTVFGAISPTGSVPTGEEISPSVSQSGSATAMATRGSLVAFLLAAVGSGFISVLTPCVFPMIPITVSFFLKQSESRESSALVLATVYVLTIIGAFTLLGAVLGPGFVALGGSPWFNAAMAAVLGALALALFGVFELRVPMFLVQWTSSRGGQGGLVGVVFMALTFVVVSTPCTGPFVGQVLVWSSQGQWAWPALGLGAYSLALASPFFVLALVPGMLASLPKAGGWMNSIKVTMGFVVFGMVFYFLGQVELTWETGLITRSLVLSIWAALGLSAALYLLGLLRLQHDSPVEAISVGRLGWAVVFLAIGLYFTAGLFGRPLSGSILALLPEDDFASVRNPGQAAGPELDWVDNSFDEALAKAKREKRPLFLDFTGKY